MNFNEKLKFEEWLQKPNFLKDFIEELAIEKHQEGHLDAMPLNFDEELQFL